MPPAGMLDGPLLRRLRLTKAVRWGVAALKYWSGGGGSMSARSALMLPNNRKLMARRFAAFVLHVLGPFGDLAFSTWISKVFGPSRKAASCAAVRSVCTKRGDTLPTLPARM